MERKIKLFFKNKKYTNKIVLDFTLDNDPSLASNSAHIGLPSR